MDSQPFTLEDHAIIESYIPVVDGIATLFGAHCEIVLHSLESLEHSAIYIANGHNTNRTIGSPVTDRALRSLHQMEQENSDVAKPYFTKAKSNGLMKSNTIAIRNSRQRIIGLLCININLDVPMSQFIATLIAPQEEESNVNFASSVEELVAQTIERTVEEITTDLNVANNNKNRQIVLSLFEKGIFDIKDAINLVADRLNISRHTVYLYIRQIKQDQD